jgi:large subunit ribosomal protein L22
VPALEAVTAAGEKTNERPGTRAVLRHSRVSAYKAREVLNLVRGVEYTRAMEILQFCERDVATPIAKLLRSAAANAEHNDRLDPEELFVAACFADEGATLKRWRPRARGRATRIRKRSCHITVILSRLPDEDLRRHRARSAAAQELRARRVAGTRRRAQAADAEATAPADQQVDEQPVATLDEDAPAAAEAAAGEWAEGSSDAPAEEEAVEPTAEADGDAAAEAEGAAEAEAEGAEAADAEEPGPEASGESEVTGATDEAAGQADEERD